jgi:hypothetical protein
LLLKRKCYKSLLGFADDLNKALEKNTINFIRYRQRIPEDWCCSKIFCGKLNVKSMDNPSHEFLSKERGDVLICYLSSKTN